MRKKTQLYILVILLSFAFTGVILSSNGKLINKENENSIKTSNGYGVYWVEAGESGDGSSETTPAGNITYILDTYDIEDKIIKVKEGIYDTSIETFPLEIDKENVTIEAVGSRSNTMIDSNGGGKYEGDGDQYKGFLITNHSTTIRGFIFMNCSAPIHIVGGINYLTDIHIENNLIVDNSFGIYAENMNNSVIEDNIIGDVIIQWSIYLHHAYYSQMINNTIMGSKKAGIQIAGGEGNILDKNNISNNPDVGIRIRSASMNNVIKNNTINNNGVEGVLIDTNSDNNTIINNKIKGNVKNYVSDPSGVYAIKIVDSDNSSIFNNNITDTFDGFSTHNEGGISLDNAHNTTIYLNNISNNDGNGIDVKNSINTNITLNVIKNNGVYNNREIMLLNVNETIIDRNIIVANKRNIIELDDCISNTILRNNLTNGPNFQIKGDLNSSDNYIYKNNFYSDLGCEFYDNNYLNSSVIGNYWSGQGPAIDSNGDHIRDYPVEGQDILDYMPAMEPIDIMDIIDPTISITDPSDDDIFCTNFTVQWTANDEKEILYYALFLEGYGWNCTDDLNEWTYTNLDNGSYTIDIYVVDKGWNYALSALNINIDTLAPTWNPTPVNQTFEVGEVVRYDCNATDPSGVIYSLNDTTYLYIDSSTGVITTNKVDLEEGVYWIEIIAEDPFGHSINAIIKITVEEPTEPSGGNIPGFSVFLLYSIIGVSVLAIVFKRKQI